MKKIDLIPCLSIVAIVILEAIALCKGIDGAYFSIALVAIAGLGGYELKSFIDKKRGGGS